MGVSESVAQLMMSAQPTAADHTAADHTDADCGPTDDHKSRVRRRRPDPRAIQLPGRQPRATVGVVRAVGYSRTRTRGR